MLLQTGNTGTVNGGTENDSIFGPAGTGSMQLLGSDGADTVDVQSTGGQTIVGGNDLSDAADTIITGGGADFIFGNGGADTIDAAGGNDTLVSGFGNDLIVGGAGNELFFGNEGNDTVDLAAGADTGFGGLGNDSLLWTGAGSPVTVRQRRWRYAEPPMGGHRRWSEATTPPMETIRSLRVRQLQLGFLGTAATIRLVPAVARPATPSSAASATTVLTHSAPALSSSATRATTP